MGKNAHFVLKICTNRFRDYTGLNTYRLWTATEKGGYGVDLQILEQDNYFCGGGFGYQTTKNQLILTRPILTAKTILWSDQNITNNK